MSWEKENLHSERSGETISLVVVVPTGVATKGWRWKREGGFFSVC